MSLLLRPSREGVPLLSLRAGLSIAEGLERADPGLRIGLKWPNDLMWGERKIGGVLCEARWVGGAPAWVAIGVGINLRNPIPAELVSTAASLPGRLGGAMSETVLDLLLPGLREIDVVTPRLGEDELDRLAGRDWLRGRPLTGADTGVGDGITPEGALRIRRPDGTLTELLAGPVELADPAASP